MVCFSITAAVILSQFLRREQLSISVVVSLLTSIFGRIVIPGRGVMPGCVSIPRRIIAAGRMFDIGFSFVSRLRRRGFIEDSFLFADNRRRRNLYLFRLTVFGILDRHIPGLVIDCGAGFLPGRRRCRACFLSCRLRCRTAVFYVWPT